MAYGLLQYANLLDERKDLLWPTVEEPEIAKATPHVKRLPQVRAVTFSVYGTLLSIAHGELLFVHPNDFIMETALEKTIQEFKMWYSMSRKPGKPSEYMRQIYAQMLDDVRLSAGRGGERHPAVRSELIWERIVQRLQKNEYTYDVGAYGPVPELSEKIAYFFHCNLQGYRAMRKALKTLSYLKGKRLRLGLIANAQLFTPIQMLRALGQQGRLGGLADLFDSRFQVFSHQVGACTPSERLFKDMVRRFRDEGIEPGEVLHVGNHLEKDIVPANKVGFSTALFAGDSSSLNASQEVLNDKGSRPDLLITKLRHLVHIVES